MEAEVRHRQAMAQLQEPSEEQPEAPEPDSAMPYLDRKEYFEAFRNLEEKILQEVNASQ